MTRWFLIAATSTLLPVTAAWPQPAPRAATASGALVKEAEPGSTDAKMYEDIAVLRLLLHRAMLKAYSRSPDRKPGDGYGWFESSEPMVTTRLTLAQRHDFPTLSPIEGVYLKGHGIVYSATLPAPPTAVHKEASRGEPKTTSAWDQARAEIRGDRPGQEAKDETPRPSLSEEILRVLADNGKNLAQLGDRESLTVTVTFRSGRYGASTYPPLSGTTGSVASPLTPVVSLPQDPTGKIYRDPRDADPDWVVKVKEAILLSALHLKQGKLKDAEATWDKVVPALGTLEKKNSFTPGEAALVLLAVEQLHKLALAQADVGATDKAHKYLTQSRTLTEKATALAEAKKQQPVAKTGALPAKLVITVQKKDLDTMGDGRMTFDEFRKASALEYLTFPAKSGDKKE